MKYQLPLDHIGMFYWFSIFFCFNVSIIVQTAWCYLQVSHLLFWTHYYKSLHLFTLVVLLLSFIRHSKAQSKIVSQRCMFACACSDQTHMCTHHIWMSFPHARCFHGWQVPIRWRIVRNMSHIRIAYPFHDYRPYNKTWMHILKPILNDMRTCIHF